MVFVVEHYLPGMRRPDLERALGRLADVTARMRTEGTDIHYLGSTIVPDDEACLSQFEAPSAVAVAEANRRAEVPFDRIVSAVPVDSGEPSET
jgi:uncharacterized protein DUF4242